MHIDSTSLLLYAVTDRTWLYGKKLADQVEESIRGGVTFVQLREKNLSLNQFVEQAQEVKKVTDYYHIPFVINDNVQVAQIVDADGVHVGQGDQSPKEIRALLGPDKIIGVTAKTVEQARKAQQDGASYLGVGAAFATSTKRDAVTIPRERYWEITQSVDIPVVAIGGIHEGNILQLQGSGIAGVAVVSALFAQPDIGKAARRLRELAEQVAKR